MELSLGLVRGVAAGRGGAKKTQDATGELSKTTYNYVIPDMYTCEDKAFFESVRTGEKCRSNIENILPSAELLEQLYRSASVRKEIKAEE